jgi:hypothetical protein
MKKTTLFALCLLAAPVSQQLSGMGYKDPEHWTLLWELERAQQNQKELAPIAQAANPSVRNKALLLSSHKNQATIVQALLAAGADPNYIDERESVTPLSRTCTGFGGTDGACIPILLDAKADVNLHLRFPHVDPALRRAIRCNNFAAISLLIAAGADTSRALEWARESYHEYRICSDEDSGFLPATTAAARVVAFFEIFFGSAAREAAQAGAPAREQENKEEDAPPAYQESPSFAIAQEDDGWL